MQLETMYPKSATRLHNHSEPSKCAQLRQRAMGARSQHAGRRHRPTPSPPGRGSPGRRPRVLQRNRHDGAVRTARPGWVLRNWESVLRKLEMLDPIVIAAIQSHCIGGGLQIALACDLRVARDDARFGITAVKEGIIPGIGMWRVAGTPASVARSGWRSPPTSSTPRPRSSGGSSTGSPGGAFEAQIVEVTDRALSMAWHVDAADEEARPTRPSKRRSRSSSRPTSSINGSRLRLRSTIRRCRNSARAPRRAHDTVRWTHRPS